MRCTLLIGACLVTAACSHSPKTSAEQILRLNQEAMTQLKSARVEFKTSIKFKSTDTPDSSTSKLSVAKPDCLRYEGPKTSGDQTILVSNPHQSVIEMSGENFDVPTTKARCYLPDGEPFQGFFDPQASVWGQIELGRKNGDSIDVSLEGQLEVAGVHCDRVHAKSSYMVNGERQADDLIYDVATTDHLIRRQIESKPFRSETMTEETVVDKLELNPSVDPKTFEFTPSKGSVHIPNLPILTTGMTAPDFSIIDVSHRSFPLSETRGKPVLLLFWARFQKVEGFLTTTEEIAAEVTSRGATLKFLAVQEGASENYFRQWLAQNQSGYGNVQLAYSDFAKRVGRLQYHIHQYPTWFLIDSKGIIQASGEGMASADAMRKDIRKALG